MFKELRSARALVPSVSLVCHRDSIWRNVIHAGITRQRFSNPIECKNREKAHRQVLVRYFESIVVDQRLEHLPGIFRWPQLHEIKIEASLEGSGRTDHQLEKPAAATQMNRPTGTLKNAASRFASTLLMARLPLSTSET